jgi:regulator of cell morphogenesis and NO signaling
MNNSPIIDVQKTVRDIVVQYPQTIKVFEKYRIDYCCGGGENLTSAAARRGVGLKELVGALEQAVRKGPGEKETQRDWSSSKLEELVDHINATHHDFLKRELPHLETILDAVMRAHSERHADTLKPLKRELTRLKSDIFDHLDIEEKVLFPRLKHKKAGAQVDPPEPAAPHGEDIRTTIKGLQEDHQILGGHLEELRTITLDYELPEDACPSFAALYKGLMKLESDLQKHVHLENNILFPRSTGESQRKI